MASEQREAYKRFEYLMSTAHPTGYPCSLCPAQQSCYEEVKAEGETSTCEERLWKYINEGV